MNSGTHLGGMVSGGLGYTDGKDSGGIAREFFTATGGYHFAPSTAERVFNQLVTNASVQIVSSCRIERVVKNGDGRLASITTHTGGTITAIAFIDATYEGDLMAAANVSFTIGREAHTTYNESAGGVLVSPPAWGCGCNWEFGMIDGTDGNGNPLPMVQEYANASSVGLGDSKVQAYNFRLCMTKNKTNSLQMPVPTTYNASEWELLRRVFATKKKSFSIASFFAPRLVDATKADVNNGGGFSTDMIGASWTWPTASYVQRKHIFDVHKNYTQSLYHFLTTAEVVPSSLKNEVLAWGLCADEFVDSGGWPHQLYVREARRMVGSFVFTQQDRVENITKSDAIALGDYNVDAHMAQRVLLANGSVTNEGCLSGWASKAGVHLRSFEIPYRVMLPRQEEASNLLVTAALSASHVGFASLRLEPQFMNIGQAAGVAAAILVNTTIEIKFDQHDIVYDGTKTGTAPQPQTDTTTTIPSSSSSTTTTTTTTTATTTTTTTTTTTPTFQTLNITHLQVILIQQGVDIGTSNNKSTTKQYMCALNRCIESQGGAFVNSTCDKHCFPLQHDEWLGSAGAWTFSKESGSAVATALKNTHLKKSTADSSSLPPNMVLAVAKGDTCLLSVDGSVVFGNEYFACSVKSISLIE